MIEWIDPNKELPISDDKIEVLVKGYSDWIDGEYKVSLWEPIGMVFSGTGSFCVDDEFTFRYWAYIN